MRRLIFSLFVFCFSAASVLAAEKPANTWYSELSGAVTLEYGYSFATRVSNGDLSFNSYGEGKHRVDGMISTYCGKLTSQLRGNDIGHDGYSIISTSSFFSGTYLRVYLNGAVELVIPRGDDDYVISLEVEEYHSCSFVDVIVPGNYASREDFDITFYVVSLKQPTSNEINTLYSDDSLIEDMDGDGIPDDQDPDDDNDGIDDVNDPDDDNDGINDVDDPAPLDPNIPNPGGGDDSGGGGDPGGDDDFVAPPGLEGKWAEIPDVRMKKVTIPPRIRQGFTEVFNAFVTRIGVNKFMELMQPRPHVMGMFCIENPIRNFNGFELPDFKACLDLDELAKSSWAILLRQMLLFVIVCMFFSACVVTLRKM